MDTRNHPPQKQEAVNLSPSRTPHSDARRWRARPQARSCAGVAGLLFVASVLGLPCSANAGTKPTLQNNQLLWVANPAANGAVVGAVGLSSTNGVVPPVVFQILSVSSPFNIEASTNFSGLLTVKSSSILASTNFFSAQVAVTNLDGAHTSSVQVLAPAPFRIAEMSSNGFFIGRVGPQQLTNSLIFQVDTNANVDSRALAALSLSPNGEIRVANSNLLDFDTQAEYTLSLTATNRLAPAGPNNEAYGRIVVVLTNINEPPVFADQAFTLPTNSTQTLVGRLKASDPENDPLRFQILDLVVGGGTVPNSYFEILNGNELHLKPNSQGVPASSRLTVMVADNALPALTNVGTITVEASKTYSRFGIPLLVPMPGHNGGASDGLPVQVVASGTNQEVYVAGMDAGKNPYLQIYSRGLYRDPTYIPLATNFVPTVIGALGTNVFVGGSETDTDMAVLYRCTTKGVLQTNRLPSCFNIVDMLVDQGKLYICGGAPDAAYQMVPYWAEVDTNLTITSGPNLVRYAPSDIPGVSGVTSVPWGVATAIARDQLASPPKVYVAGYFKFSWEWYYYANGWNKFWNIKSWKTTPGRCTFLTTNGAPTGGIKWVQTTKQDDETSGSVIKALKVKSLGSTSLYVLQENAVNGVRSVHLSEYTTGLGAVTSKDALLISGKGDVRAEGLTIAGELGEEALYLSGVIPGSQQTDFKSGISSASLYPSGDRFFLTKLDLDLKLSQGWSTPLLMSLYNYFPTGGLPLHSMGAALVIGTAPRGPRAPLAILVPYESKGGVLLAGNIASGTLTVAQSGNQNSVTADGGRNAGFVTIVKTNKAFEIPNYLEVVSEFGLSDLHVQPFAGKQMREVDETETVIVKVLSPLYVGADGSYLNSFTNDITSDQVRTQAVTRYVCTGYSVADQDTIGSSSSYSFKFTKNTKITFHWTVEHALEINSDLTGTGSRGDPAGGFERDSARNLGLTSLASGNPRPEVKKHWIKQDELVIPTIDGSAMDPAEFGTRYVVTGYVATGWAASGTNIAFELRTFPEIEPRQQIPQFPMRGPAGISYRWGVQHRVQLSTSTLESQAWPGIMTVDDPAQSKNGSGEFWFKRDAHLIIGGRQTNRLQGALLATGDLAPPRDLSKEFLSRFESNRFSLEFEGVSHYYLGAHVPQLSKGTIVTWEYGGERHQTNVVIGDPVDVLVVAGQDNFNQINANQPPQIQVLDSPPGSTGPDMCAWDQVARRSYPLRPGRFLLHYEGRDSSETVLTLDVTSVFPAQPHYRQLTHPDMPAVNLDPDPNDNLAFLKLAFATNATVNGSEFIAKSRDMSVLVFTQSDSNAVPYLSATGNTNKETLLVRVVATRTYEDPAGPGRQVYIGTKVTSAADTAGLGTGFIVYTNAPYNAAIYARTRIADAGPIIPVNRQVPAEDVTRALVIVWYEGRDGILWPYVSERFDPQWPVALYETELPDPLPDVETMTAQGTNYLRRIVIASRLGSEGKDHALRNQLSFASPRYEQVTIYSQPNTNLPGYNPNEEHAFIVPSFKFLDHPNPPPAAYALRNDLNRTNPTNHTSEPYVLVQYFDHGTNGGVGEYKMAVYTVEQEDDRPQLNPDRYVSPLSGQTNDFPYVFHYSMKAGEPVQPPYPLGLVIGLAPCRETFGTNPGNQRVYWEDYNGQPWAVSAGDFFSYFHYPLLEDFWMPDPVTSTPGTCIPFVTRGKVVLTGRIPNPMFIPGGEFMVNDVVLRMNGVTPDDFVLAVNTSPTLKNQVRAAVLNTGEIQLRAQSTNGFELTELAFGPLGDAGLNTGPHQPTPAVFYTALWPDAVPILKAGETLTYAGGEYKAEYPAAKGLPGVIGWAAGEVIFDTMNPLMDNKAAFTNYTARLISPLEERSVTFTDSGAIQPSTGITKTKGTRWQFTGLPASLGKRISYDPINRRLAIKGFVNEKTLGDSTLTATPSPVYVLEPNILTPAEREELGDLLPGVPEWQTAVLKLYETSRNPAGLSNPATEEPNLDAFLAGLDQDIERDNAGTPLLDDQGDYILRGTNTAAPLRALGPGLALVPSPAVLDPKSRFTNGYLTVVENNNPDAGGPISLHIIKVSKEYRYRGAIKTILSENVFDEKVTLRHSGDFGANTADIVYQWFYREEDGTESPLPPGGAWKIFPDQTENVVRGLGNYQINLEGTGGLLLADNLFFVRYRHLRDDDSLAGPNSTDWTGTEWDQHGRFETRGGEVMKVGTHWAGAANSPTVDGEYKPQLVMGWIKRVLDRVNPYESRISDFRNETAPATYVSMIQEFGQRYEGPVALNPDKNVIENVGLIELYETILDRGMDLSINLSSPITSPGINTALQLAATRISDFYMVFGDEAYADAQDPTIAYGDDQMDFATDYGNFVSSMFSFQNQAASLLDEELALLRGVPQSYSRPVYNRLFWNFTKSLGEVAYAVNYNITDYNRDGFVNESDAMSLYPQGHGDAWGHYLTALKSHYRLLRHPYYNWVPRAEQYNLMDVVLEVDYLDERRFAEAAAVRAKTGAEILSLTYRSRYVEDPDGQWQGYADLDEDRAWGVDGWARRAGQGALFDWMTANAIIPSANTNHQANALQKIDRTTVTAIQTLASELGEIQSQYDNANNGLNPLGLSPDVVPFDLDATFNAIGSVAQVGRSAVQAMGHFSQIYERAVTAIANARTVFDSANFMQGRQRQVKESADSLRQEVIEGDLDFRNRLIEIFGTPYEGQIGTGKAYPAGYYGPDLMLWMYVDVNDVNSDTVPPSFTNVTAWVEGFEQQVANANSGTGVNDFVNLKSKYFFGDLSGVTNVDQLDFEGTSILALTNLPVAAAGYTFQAPVNWGRRASPGELQLTICEMVQAEADLQLAIGDYFAQVERIQDIVDLLEAKHYVAAKTINLKIGLRDDIVTMNRWMQGLRTTGALLLHMADYTKNITDATAKSMDSVFGFAVTPLKIPKIAVDWTKETVNAILRNTAFTFTQIADIIETDKERYQLDADIDISKEGFKYEIQEQLKELEQNLRNERLLRVEAFKRLESLRQVSDRYRRTLEGGRRLLDERQVFNIRSAGVAQRLRYQDMSYRVFRNDALQKYRAAYDLASRYTYMAAKAFDYETNFSPDDRASAQPLLTQIVRSRVLGGMQNGEPIVGGGGLAAALATLRDNWNVLCGRMSFNNAQYEQELLSLRRELFRIPYGGTNDALWRQTLKQYCVDDLWQVPEFRRYCRPPAPRSAGSQPGLVIPFGTEIVLGRNVFGWPLGPGDHAYDPSLFATKVQSAAVYFTNYQTANLSATPRVYLVPAGLDIMTIPTSVEMETREWTIVDQAIPVPFQTGANDLADPYWIPAYDSLSEPFGQIRRFSSFLAKDITAFDPASDALSYDTRLIGRSVWNTRWLLIIPGGHLLADGQEGLDTLIDGAKVPGAPLNRDLNGIKDIQLLFHTYGYSGN